MSTLYLHVDHDSTATFIDKNDDVRVLELERFTKRRFAVLSQEQRDPPDPTWDTTEDERVAFLKYIKKISKPIEKVVYHAHLGRTLIEKDRGLLEEIFTDNIELCFHHHLYHASVGYYMSGFDKAVVVSMDGGGNSDFEGATNMAWCNAFHAEDGYLQHTVSDTQNNLGCAYGSLGWYMTEIQARGDNAPPFNKLELPFAGKIMGLCAYGNIREEWLTPLEKYFRSPHWWMWEHDVHWEESLELQKDFGIPLGRDCFEGQQSYDFAATAQRAFENVAMSLVEPYIENYDNFVLTGGCALNVLFNQKLKKRLDRLGKNLYVPPNPNDCGLSTGMFLLDHPDRTVSPYSGFNILDIEKLEDYIEERGAKKIDNSGIVDLLKAGKIIGLVEGGSEVGPRALGNRSIICDPSIPGMKDTLNSKVKYREWFRPFAPVCRYEDMHKYFYDVYESEYMSYAPYIKPDYVDKLSAVCHADDTARLQTVRSTQHQRFYDILTELHDRGEIAVILNTSFNIRGNPILTTIEDALLCLDETEMDYVVIDGWLFERKV